MEYKTCAIIQRKGKEICFFLKEGEILSYENIVDVEIYGQPDRLNKKTSEEDVIVKTHDESVRDRSEAIDPPM